MMFAKKYHSVFFHFFDPFGPLDMRNIVYNILKKGDVIYETEGSFYLIRLVHSVVSLIHTKKNKLSVTIQNNE